MLILRPVIRYADFKGRARRLEYWGFGFAQLMLQGLLGAAAMTSMAASGGDVNAGGMAFLTWLVLAGLIGAALFVPNQAVLARRLHDTGRSAWWMLLQAPNVVAPILIMGAISSAAATGGNNAQVQAMAVMSALGGGLLIFGLSAICNLVLSILTMLPGDKGENRFGPDPRNRLASIDGRLAGMDEDRLNSLIAEAKAQRGAVRETSPVEALQKSVFDFGFDTPAPAPVAAPAEPEPEWRFREAPSAPVFGRRNARPV